MGLRGVIVVLCCLVGGLATASPRGLITRRAAAHHQAPLVRRRSTKPRRLSPRLVPSVSVARPLEEQNLFLPAAYRDLDASRVPRALVNETRVAIEAALGSVFSRMTVPVMVKGKRLPQNKRLFAHLESTMKTKGFRILPAGGVVRSALGYLLTRIHAELLKDPRRGPVEILRQIARERGDVSGWEIKGNGSDFDLLLRGPRKKLEAAKQEILSIVNSVESGFKLEENRAEVKRNLLFVGDVKPYEEQTERATSQGGVTLDFLAYDPGGKRMIAPKAMPGILDSFIRGQIEYIAPRAGASAESSQKQVIRGIRPLMEFPFLSYGDPARFVGELGAMKKSIAAGHAIDAKALEQLGKAVRNARFGGVNRIHAEHPGPVERAIADLNRTIKQKTNSQHFIPQFVRLSPVELRDGKRSELRGIPETLLMPVKEFIKGHTMKGSGVLLHGTPSVDFALSINRQGLYVSSDKQGTAAYGYGGYLTPRIDTASAYASKTGVVMRLKIKNNERLNILDWEKVKDHPAMKKIIAAKPKDQELFEYLAKDHGIDLIVVSPEIVLVENFSAIQNTFGIKEMLDIQLQGVKNPRLAYANRLKLLVDSQNLISYGQARGILRRERSFSIPAFIERGKKDFLRTRSRERRRDILAGLHYVGERGFKLPKGQSWLRSLQRFHDTTVRQFKRARGQTRRMALLDSITHLYSFPVDSSKSVLQVLGAAVRSTRSPLRSHAISLLEPQDGFEARPIVKRMVAASSRSGVKALATRLIRSDAGEEAATGMQILQELAKRQKIDTRAVRKQQLAPDPMVQWQAARLLTDLGLADHITVKVIESTLGYMGPDDAPYKKTYRYYKQAKKQAAKLPPPSIEVRRQIEQLESWSPAGI